MNRDVLNHEATSSKAIKNITVGPTVIDKGAYYIIKLNYPDVAEEESRQYKWKIDGTWKTYDPQGILLIKEGFTLPDLGGGYQVEDENGNTVIFRDHYYQLDCPLSEVSENLYMRWDSGKPAAPTIMVDPSNTSTREVTVVINYPQEAARRLYKTVTVDGVDSGWMEYTSSFKIDKKGTMIYAKSVNRLELESKLVTKTITHIDEEAPELTLIGKWTSLDDPKQKVSVTVKATDDVALDVIKYAKGNQSVDYFNNNGTLVNNNTTVMLDENGEWTFYAVDKVGNAIIEVITVENIDTTAPQIVITDITEEFGSTARISIDYGDSDLKQYKICSTGTYTNYTGIIEINGTDYSSCQNSDGSLTVYAKGKDQAGNETEVTEDIYTIDLDKPAAPIISASAGYPILTEYGVKYDDALTVVYDNRSDIINYIDLGNGEGWKVYTGSEHVASGTVKAKSVKKTTGLESDVVTKSVTRPSNALGSAAYDGDKSTAASGDGTIIKVDSSMIGKYLDITIAGHGNKNPYYSTTQFRRVDGTVIKEENFNTSWDPATTQFYIPEETDSLVFTRYYSNVYEIRPYDDALIHETKMYPKLTESGVDQGYNTVTIDYFNTSIVRQYKIVPSGENEEDYAWLNHPDTDLRLELGETIYARGIDKNATPTVVRNYTSVLPSDALQPAGYDGNASTSASGNGTRIDVDSAMIGKKLSIRISGDGNKSPYYSTTQFKKADGTVIKSENYNSSTTPSTTQFYIPEETAYLSFIRYYSYVYEIGPDITPVVLLDSKHYPMIDVDKVEFGYNLVNLAYLSTLPTKLYKIGDDEWQDFNQNPIKVEAGKTLSVKAISSNGTESTVVNYISVLPDDTLSANAYDDNLNTVATIAANSTYTVDLSSNLVDYRFKVSLSAMPTSNGYVKIYDENNNEITSSTISDVSTYIDIPSGATRMKISA